MQSLNGNLTIDLDNIKPDYRYLVEPCYLVSKSAI